MIVYHGTYEEKAKRIIESGRILSVVERNYSEDALDPTTDGYVYLTDKLANAIYYGGRVKPQDKPDSIFVFEIDINEFELEVDYDEVKAMDCWRSVKEELVKVQPLTYLDSLRILHTARIPRDIILGVDCNRFMILPSQNEIIVNKIFDKPTLKLANLVSSLSRSRQSTTEDKYLELFNLVEWNKIL